MAMATPAYTIRSYANKLVIQTADGRLLVCHTDTKSCQQYTLPSASKVTVSDDTISAVSGLSAFKLDEQSGEWVVNPAPTSNAVPAKNNQAKFQEVWKEGYGELLPDYYSLWFANEHRWVNLALPKLPPKVTAAVPSWDGRCIWILAGNQLMKISVATRKAAILLPWNASGVSLKGISPAPNGIWVASSAGIMLVDNAEDHPVFVKAKLDSELDGYLTESEEKLVALVEKWQGTPYQYGAQSCQVSTDCSGFVTSVYQEMGFKLPRSSQLIGKADALPTVTDELQIGDLLVMPGHVAMYMGNGLTVEASSSRGVTWGTVYGRVGVTVKRVMPKS